MHENVYAWSDGMGSQFRSRDAFKLLACTVLPGRTLSWYYNERHHGKGPMDGIAGTVKNVIFRKVRSVQMVVYSPLEFSEAATKFVSSSHSVYLPENEKVIESENILKARTYSRMDQVKFFKGCLPQFLLGPFLNTLTQIICGYVETSESDDECAKCQGSYNGGEEWLCCTSCHQWYL